MAPCSSKRAGKKVRGSVIKTGRPLHKSLTVEFPETSEWHQVTSRVIKVQTLRD